MFFKTIVDSIVTVGGTVFSCVLVCVALMGLLNIVQWRQLTCDRLSSGVGQWELLCTSSVSNGAVARCSLLPPRGQGCKWKPVKMTDGLQKSLSRWTKNKYSGKYLIMCMYTHRGFRITNNNWYFICCFHWNCFGHILALCCRREWSGCVVVLCGCLPAGDPSDRRQTVAHTEANPSDLWLSHPAALDLISLRCGM